MRKAGFAPRGLYVAILLSIATVFFSGSRLLAGERPTAEFQVDFLSQYVWRGYGLSSDSAVIQPSMTVSYKGFSANLWGNYDTDEDDSGAVRGPEPGTADWNETDLSLSYTYDRLPCGLALNMGTISYALDAADDSFELFAGISGVVPKLGLGLGFTAYREVSHYPGWWLQFDLSRSFALACWGVSLELGASFIYQASEDEGAYPDPDDPTEAYSAWHAGQIAAALNIPLNRYVTVSPKLGYSFALSGQASDVIEMLSWDEDDDHFSGGVAVSVSF